jgi:glycosyltransferase involved in cell wall biosynthesis
MLFCRAWSAGGMKVALVSDWFLPRVGGLELQMRDLALQLMSAGHQVEVITATAGADQVDGIPVWRIDGRPHIAYGQLSWRPRVARDVTRLIATRGYDVVHCHSAFSPMSLMACRAAHRLGVPTVLTEHSVTHGAGGWIMDGSNRLTGWSRWPDIITGVSSVVVKGLRSLLRRRVHLLHNGITPGDWTQSAQTGQTLRVLTVMRIMPRKRPLDFVRAVPRVMAALPADRKPLFVMVGEGPLREHAEHEARRLKVSEHLHFTGLLDRTAVRGELARSSVFALPTTNEALSIASLEALASGVPVVAMRRGGVSDIVTHGQTGFLAGNIDEFAAHIAQLVADDELRLRMADLGPAATERFSWTRILARHLEIYEMAIATASRRRNAREARLSRLQVAGPATAKASNSDPGAVTAGALLPTTRSSLISVSRGHGREREPIE